VTEKHALNQLASVIHQTINDTIRTNRSYTETLGEQAVRDGSAVGHVSVEGAGESTAVITFPIVFVEKPVFTAGLELGENVALVQGSFPTWSATVRSWQTRTQQNTPLYVGATLGIVVNGVAKSILHYRFEARSFMNPVGPETSVTATL
jgi:hypothetical protein